MPTAPAQTKILKLDDLKIAELTADDAANLTYGALVDIPGAMELAVTPEVETLQLEGDNKVLDIFNRVKTAKWSFQNAKIPLDALAIILGGAVAQSGTTPNTKQTYTLLGADTGKYFKLEGQSKYGDGGDTHVIYYKCKADKAEWTIGNDYATLSASGVSIPTVNNDKIVEVVVNETATAIA